MVASLYHLCVRKVFNENDHTDVANQANPITAEVTIRKLSGNGAKTIQLARRPACAMNAPKTIFPSTPGITASITGQTKKSTTMNEKTNASQARLAA